MLKIKINKFCLKGIRGVKTDCPVDLNGKSILLYGESGTGKSSISDVFEWFFYDKVGHLSGEEISRSGVLEALRNITLSPDRKSSVSIEFNNTSLNSAKDIYLKGDSLIADYSNNSTGFKDLLKEFQNENFILRHDKLTEFVLSRKGEKLESLSNIIGFSEITKVKSVLKKSLNELLKMAKNKGYDNLIQAQQSHLLEYLNKNIVSEEQYINTINDLVKPLGLNFKIVNLADIDKTLNSIKTPDNTEKIKLQSFYVKIQDFASSLESKINDLKKSYKSFYNQYQKILNDIDMFQKIALSDLLTEGQRILKEGLFVEDQCPLCLQDKNRENLLKELDIRLKKLEKFNNERRTLDDLKSSLKSELNNLHPILKSILADKNLSLKDNDALKGMCDSLNTQFIDYSTALNADIAKLTSIKAPEELGFNKDALDRVLEFCKESVNQITSSMGNDLILKISSKAHLSNIAYKQIKQFKKEEDVLKSQINSMKLAYKEFVKRQQENLQSFLTLFSKDINDLYQFMNPGENVNGIELIPFEKDDELTGLTLQYQFFKNRVKPPHKYLSESHLNCLGIAYFLTSVRVFNKGIGFLIIDDVISSFDSNHRARFSDLLINKFSDYQIILLTHEKNWFDYVENSVKGRKWIVGSIKWSDDLGTHLEEPPENLKERIENNIKKGNVESLGNDIRKYLEFLLKQIALNLRVKVEFRFNNKNEDRMSHELLTCLLAELKNQNNSDFKPSREVIIRLLDELFLGSKESHDSSFVPALGDFKAFWDDVEELEKLFFCSSCGKFISLDYFDKIANEVRCSCPKKHYFWKV
jgi:hypothetical protein